MWHTISLELDIPSLSLSLIVDGSSSELSIAAAQVFKPQSTELVIGDELVQNTYIDGYNVFRLEME